MCSIIWDDLCMQGRERADRRMRGDGELGVLAGRRGGAGDSTILADAVATQDTITQLVAAIRRCARLVPGAAELIASVCAGHDYSQPGKPRIDWHDPAAKDALVSAR